MILEKEDLQDFKQLYLKKFGIELPKEQTLEYTLKLVNLVKTILDSNIQKVGKI